tara:strand:- start:3786 stop:4904 length:1119 start_codon:yes stop_codon:yes gene_type:complete
MALNFTNLTALTRDKFLPVLVDNIFNSNVLTFKLLKNAEKLDGGKKIITPIEYGTNASQGFYSGYSALTTTTTEVITAAEWDWTQAWAGITISGEEEHKNMGDSQVLSLLKSKLKNAEKSLKDLFGNTMFGNALPSGGKFTSLIGTGTIASSAYDDTALIDLAAGNSTATFHAPGDIDNCIIGYNRTLGGINSKEDGSAGNGGTWWDSKMASFATGSSAVTTAATWDELIAVTNGTAFIIKKMTQMYSSLTIDNDSPDIIITTNEIYDAYESALQANKRFAGNQELADAGFQNLAFRGAAVVVDSHCPAGMMVMLNTRYLDFKVHNKRNFTFDGFKKREDSDAMVAKIFWMGQLVCTNPRMQGMIVGGPASY